MCVHVSISTRVCIYDRLVFILMRIWKNLKWPHH